MNRVLIGAVAAAALAGGVPASAQVRGIPVDNSGVARGVGVYADIGFPNDEAGGGRAYALTGKAGLGVLGFTGTLASYDPEGADASVAVGATINYRIFGGPLVPLAVNLQGGIGYYAPDTDSPFDFDGLGSALPGRSRLRPHDSQSGPRHPSLAGSPAGYHHPEGGGRRNEHGYRVRPERWHRAEHAERLRSPRQL